MAELPNPISTFQLVDAGVHFGLALVWALVAHNAWIFLRTRRPQSHFFRMLPFVAAAVAFSYGEFTAIILLRPLLHPQSLRVLFLLNDWCVFFTVTSARHMSVYFSMPERPRPSALWLATNYGAFLMMCAFAAVALGAVQVPAMQPYTNLYRVIRVAYQLVVLGSVVWQLLPVVRPGVWEAGGAAWVPRRADVAMLVCGIVSLAAFLLASAPTLTGGAQPWEGVPLVRNLVLDTITGVGFALPLAVRAFGSVLRGVLMTATMLAAIAAVYFGVDRLSIAAPVPGLRALAPIATILVLGLLVVPGQAWLRSLIDQLVFRRSRRRRADLQTFVHGLSPELGAAECGQRAVVEMTRVMPLRGAAMLLRDGQVFVHGTIIYAPVATLWGTEAAQQFPTHPLVGFALRELADPLSEALTRTDVVGVLPIISPRQRWGVLLISAGLLGATFSEEDEQVLQGFTDQLALVLDGAELLARAVAVERSLAHSEKLAAIGELAARVAHEIRNPVTAARSLAQQMARDPLSPLNAEHAELILAELERVERQVAALLRFARREEFHFEPTDLAELTRTTLAGMRSRLDAAGIAVALDANDHTVVRGDREKLRQVLINLIENALDALSDAHGAKRLELAVDRVNGSGRLRVQDNGPSVPADVVPRLFEPFFSLKPHGTGLGLAIARRTVEAHGGHIDASATRNGGLALCIDLPLIDPQDSGSRTRVLSS